MTGIHDTPPRRITVVLGSMQFTGITAFTILLLILAGIVTLIVKSHPTSASIPMFISAALWIAFVTYWSAAARKAGKAKRAESGESRRVHERMLNGALLLLFIPVPGLRGRFIPDTSLVIAMGLIVQIASGTLGVWARRHLGRNWSGAISTVENQELVRSGPYGVLRHPIYTAMLGMFIGPCIVSGEWHALAAVLLIAYAYWRKIRLEERHLDQLFGESYDDYRRSSWALVPLLY